MKDRNHLKFKIGDVLTINSQFEGHSSFNESIFVVIDSANSNQYDWLVIDDEHLYIYVYEHEMIKIGEL